MELETRLAILQGDVARQNTVIGKIETMIEKLGEVSNSVAKLLAVHEEKLSQHQETHAELFTIVEAQRDALHSDVKSLNGRISSIHLELSTSISQVENNLKTALKTGLNEIKTAIKDETKTIEKDHEQRIRDLERWRWIVVGGSIIGGIFARDFINLFLK